jgi:hypothetical protein
MPRHGCQRQHIHFTFRFQILSLTYLQLKGEAADEPLEQMSLEFEDWAEVENGGGLRARRERMGETQRPQSKFSL